MQLRAAAEPAVSMLRRAGSIGADGVLRGKDGAPVVSRIIRLEEAE